MTQRSMMTGPAPVVVIKTTDSLVVEGWESERVQAESAARKGLKIETRRAGEVGRARAALGEQVLFDLRIQKPGARQAGEVVEVTLGGEGKVQVPSGSYVKVYAGNHVEAKGIQGTLAIYAGGDARVRQANALAQISAGGSVDVECETVEGEEVKFEAGGDLRCDIRGLTDARVLVNDLGSAWEGRIGDGRVTVRLKAGGDVTLVTDQEVEGLPPGYVLGQVERRSVSD